MRPVPLGDGDLSTVSTSHSSSGAATRSRLIRLPVVIVKRGELKGAVKFLMKTCAGPAGVAGSMRERLCEWYRQPVEAHLHRWRLSPGDRLAVCEDAAPYARQHIPLK